LLKIASERRSPNGTSRADSLTSRTPFVLPPEVIFGSRGTLLSRVGMSCVSSMAWRLEKGLVKVDWWRKNPSCLGDDEMAVAEICAVEEDKSESRKKWCVGAEIE
jgi:hypothetical protein